jgi:hypothetical protein
MKKKNILLALTAVSAASLSGFAAVNGFALQPVEAETAMKKMIFNTTTNLPSAVGTEYIAETMYQGTSTGVVAKLSKGSAITDPVTLGGSHIAAVTFTTDVTDSANAYLELTTGAQNLDSVAVSLSATMANSSSSVTLSFVVTSLDGATSTESYSIDYSHSLDSQNLATTLKESFVIGSVTSRITAHNFKAGDMLALDYSMIVWIC